MNTYAKNSFTHLNKDEILKSCVEGIKSYEEGEPKSYCLIHTYAGEHEEIISEFHPTLDEAIDDFIHTLNINEWSEDDIYLSIEGNWSEDEDEDGELDDIGILWTIHAEEFNEPED